MGKEYRDYGEYLEEAYEEWAEQEAGRERAATRSEQYGQPSNRLTITEKNGELEAEWSRIEKGS